MVNRSIYFVRIVLLTQNKQNVLWVMYSVLVTLNTKMMDLVLGTIDKGENVFDVVTYCKALSCFPLWAKLGHEWILCYNTIQREALG